MLAPPFSGMGGRFPPQNVEKRTKGAQRTLRGRSEALRGRSEGAQRRAESLRERSEDDLVQLTLSSDPRMWMGGRIPSRWLRYGRDRRLRRQIDTRTSRSLSKKLSFLDTCSKKHKRAIGFKAILRPPFYTLITVGKVY